MDGDSLHAASNSGGEGEERHFLFRGKEMSQRARMAVNRRNQQNKTHFEILSFRRWFAATFMSKHKMDVEDGNFDFPQCALQAKRIIWTDGRDRTVLYCRAARTAAFVFPLQHCAF